MTQTRTALIAAAALAVLAGPTAPLAQSADAVQAAADAYVQYDRGDFAAAAALAEAAVTAEPYNEDYRLLWADALLASGRAGEAHSALQVIAHRDDYRIQMRLAEAASALGGNYRRDAAEAYRRAAALAPDGSSRTYLTRARIAALLDMNEASRAAREMRSAWAQGVLPGDQPIDVAYLAVRAGADDLAQKAFTAGDARGWSALDAGYSALRLGRGDDAIAWFERGLEGSSGDRDIDPGSRQAIRNQIDAIRWR